MKTSLRLLRDIVLPILTGISLCNFNCEEKMIDRKLSFLTCQSDILYT